jgi:predicted nuclease with TOPRIM domain
VLTQTNQSNSLSESKLAYSVSMAEHETALSQIKQLESLQQESNIKITSLEEEIKRLKEQVQLMQQRHFGKKSEVNAGEPTVEANDTLLQTISGYTRKKGRKSCGRTIDTSKLPRH